MSLRLAGRIAASSHFYDSVVQWLVIEKTYRWKEKKFTLTFYSYFKSEVQISLRTKEGLVDKPPGGDSHVERTLLCETTLM